MRGSSVRATRNASPDGGECSDVEWRCLWNGRGLSGLRIGKGLERASAAFSKLRLDGTFVAAAHRQEEKAQEMFQSLNHKRDTNDRGEGQPEAAGARALPSESIGGIDVPRKLMSRSGAVFNMMKYCLHDGPGIRTIVFLKGCPLRCWWCHNPEGQVRHPEIAFRESRCIRCGDCFALCAQGAVDKIDDRYVIAEEKCIQCGECVEVCYAEAREIAGKEMTVAEVMKEVEKDRVFYDESGGGVTFSGGEPLMQHDYLLALLQVSRALGIHTAVETTGYTTPEILKRVSNWTDLFLYDIKVIDDQRHRDFTGVSNERILDNLKRLSSWGANVIVRVPVVPGVSDSEENARSLATFLTQSTMIKEVHLLPFHMGGREKYERFRRPSQTWPEQPLSTERAEALAVVIQSFGLSTRIGG